MITLNFVQFGDNNIVEYYIYQGELSDSLLIIDSTINNSFEISGLTPGEIYYFQVSSINNSGNESPVSNMVTFTPSNALSINKTSHDIVFLSQNYPNPFNPITSIQYDLPKDGLVNITIYDMVGRVVKTLVNSEQGAGYKSVIWDATNNDNSSVAGGLYLYMIRAKDYRQTRKMILLK